MIKTTIQATGRVSITLSKTSWDTNVITLTMADKGEHDNDPNHRYYTPSSEVKTILSESVIDELITSLKRMM